MSQSYSLCDNSCAAFCCQYCSNFISFSTTSVVQVMRSVRCVSLCVRMITSEQINDNWHADLPWFTQVKFEGRGDTSMCTVTRERCSCLIETWWWKWNWKQVTIQAERWWDAEVHLKLYANSTVVGETSSEGCQLQRALHLQISVDDHS